MVMMEMGLSEKISPPWKRDRDVDEKVQEVRKPRTMGPKRRQQGQFQTPRRAYLLQNLGDQTEWREGVRLEPVPGLKESVHPSRLRILQGREIYLETMVE